MAIIPNDLIEQAKRINYLELEIPKLKKEGVFLTKEVKRLESLISTKDRIQQFFFLSGKNTKTLKTTEKSLNQVKEEHLKFKNELKTSKSELNKSIEAHALSQSPELERLRLEMIACFANKKTKVTTHFNMSPIKTRGKEFKGKLSKGRIHCSISELSYLNRSDVMKLNGTIDHFGNVDLSCTDESYYFDSEGFEGVISVNGEISLVSSKKSMLRHENAFIERLTFIPFSDPTLRKQHDLQKQQFLAIFIEFKSEVFILAGQN